MITCGSWHDIWLNEGFATYATALFQERMFPNDWEAWKTSVIKDVTSETGGSVYRYDIPGKTEIFENRYTYNKAALVLHMLRYVLGDDVFFQAVWNYSHDPNLRFKSAYTDDLRKHFEDVSGKDLSEFFDSWVYKEGYPVYDMTVEQTDINNAVLKVRQTPSHPSVSCFKIPLTVSFTGEGGVGKVIVFDNDQPVQEFTFDPGFIVTDVVFDPDKRILCKYEIKKTTGINSPQNDELFKIFPNPARDAVNVKTNFEYSVKWKLADIGGKTLKSGISNSGKDFTIDTSDLNSGAYLVTFLTDFKEYSTKLMIVK
jgi:aminopeptidase N